MLREGGGHLPMLARRGRLGIRDWGLTQEVLGLELNLTSAGSGVALRARKEKGYREGAKRLIQGQ